MLGADLARGVVGKAPHRDNDAVPPEGRAQAVEGGDGQQLGHLAAGELALEPPIWARSFQACSRPRTSPPCR